MESENRPVTQDDKSQQTLFQYYTPVFALISTLEVSRDYGDPEELAVKTIQLLNTVRDTLNLQGMNMDWVSDSQYAVVAFVDESINRSQWHGREAWQKMPLAARLGLQANTGIIFFEKLNGWMKSPAPPIEVLEVFYVCLGLGFQGQFFNQQDKLTQIKQDLLRKLSGDLNPPDMLSPNGARKADERIDPVSDSFPWVWYTSIAVGFLLILFTVLKLISRSDIDDLVKSLTG